MPRQSRALHALYFGKDDAETDIAAGGLLRHGFLKTVAYEAAMTGRKRLIIGRKGSGKSAICMMLARSGLDVGRVSLVTPDEISAEELRRFELEGIAPEQSKSLVWRYVMAIRLAKALVAHAQHRHRGNRQPDSVGALRKFLLANGEVEDPNFQERFWKAIQRIKSSLSLEAFGVKVGVAIEEAPSEGIRASNELEVVERNVGRAMQDLACGEDHGPLLLLVDQLEKVWSNDRDSDAMVIGLLIATRHVSANLPGAVCVAFLRSDIYDQLQFQDRDKFRGDELRIDWTAEHLLELVLTRARASVNPRLRSDELWDGLFPSRIGTEPTSRFVVNHTLMRPRDIIQLCNACRDTAKRNGHHRILPEDVHAATALYSSWKLDDLANEYLVNYPFLKDLFILFQHSSYMLARDAVAHRIRTLHDALATRYPEFVQIFNPETILDVLYGIGFLGVVRDGTTTFSYQDPVRIEPHETRFVIHPAFREACRSVSSIALRPFEPVVAIQRFAAERSNLASEFVEVRPGRSTRWFAYSQRALEQLKMALVDAGFPSEIHDEIKQNLRAIEVEFMGVGLLGPHMGERSEVTVEQREFARRTQRFLQSLDEKLVETGWAAEAHGARFLKELELASRRIDPGLREYR